MDFKYGFPIYKSIDEIPKKNPHERLYNAISSERSINKHKMPFERSAEEMILSHANTELCRKYILTHYKPAILDYVGTSENLEFIHTEVNNVLISSTLFMGTTPGPYIFLYTFSNLVLLRFNGGIKNKVFKERIIDYSFSDDEKNDYIVLCPSDTLTQANIIISMIFGSY